jgi:hypothetical protein
MDTDLNHSVDRLVKSEDHRARATGLRAQRFSSQVGAGEHILATTIAFWL